MKELQPASEMALTNLKTLQKGLEALREKRTQREFFRSTEFKDPTVCFQHPKDGLVTTTLDDKLLSAMSGGIMGAFQELQSEGFGDIAKRTIKENK